MNWFDTWFSFKSDKSFYDFCLYVADIFVELDSVDDELEIFEAVETFELAADICSATFAGVRWLLRRRIAAFFSATEIFRCQIIETKPSFQPAMILWKGLSLIDSWTHLIHPSLSSSVAVDNLKIDNCFLFEAKYPGTTMMTIIRAIVLISFFCLRPKNSSIIVISSPIILLVALDDGAIIVFVFVFVCVFASHR